MSLRPHICDRELKEACGELKRVVWSKEPLWPPDPPGDDAVISIEDDKMYLTSESGSFKHIEGGDENNDMPDNTVGLLVDVGFFRVVKVESNTKLEIICDGKSAGTSFKIVPDDGPFAYVIGGFTHILLTSFNKAWHKTKFAQSIALSEADNPLSYTIPNRKVYHAIYVPDEFDGADDFIKYDCLTRILLAKWRNESTALKKRFDVFSKLCDRELINLSFEYDYSVAGIADEMLSSQQITNRR